MKSRFEELQVKQARERAEVARVVAEGSEEELRAMRARNHAGFHGLHWHPGIRQELDVVL